MKGNMVWAHFTATGYHPTQIRLARQVPKESVHITTTCCFFKAMHIQRDNMAVTGISGIDIKMPIEVKVSIFMDNDLTHINEDHFKINLIAQLLKQIYIAPTFPLRHDDFDDINMGITDQPIPSILTGVTASAPPFSFSVS